MRAGMARPASQADEGAAAGRMKQGDRCKHEMNGLALSQSVIDEGTGSASAAFAQAYVQGFPQTIKFLVKKGVSFTLAEELAQVAWVRGWEARRQLKLRDCTIAWINTIAYRRFCNHQRRIRRMAELRELPDERLREPALALDAALLLGRCSPLERALLEQRYVEGIDLREIAAAHGLSEMAVRLRLHRCRHSLRKTILAGGR